MKNTILERYWHKIEAPTTALNQYKCTINQYKCTKCNRTWLIFKDEIEGKGMEVTSAWQTPAWLDIIWRYRSQIYCNISDEEYNLKQLLR